MARIALVTGGSRGIGFGIASALAAEKWDLVINGVRPESAVSEPLAALRARGVRVAYAPGDIGSAEGRESVLAATRAFAGGPPTLLVNNAGVAPRVRADLLEMSAESYDRVLDTNLKGPFFLTQAVAREMVAAKKADASIAVTIVNITSISATVVSINRGEYCIAKAGLSMLSPEVKAFSKNDLAAYLRTLKDDSVSEIFVSGADGTKVAFLSKTSNWSHKGKPKHDVPMSGKTWTGKPELDESTGVQQVQVGLPVLDGGKAVGSIVVGLNLSKL